MSNVIQGRAADGTNKDFKVDSFGNIGTGSNDTTASGTISTQNLVPLGVATALSAVEIDCSGLSTVSIQTVGTYTGALSPQFTIDGVNWITVTALSLLKTDGVYSATIPSAIQGIFVIDVSGYARFRMTALAAVTGSVVVSLRGSTSAGLIGIDNALPTGTNSIGTVVLGSPATAATTSITKAEDGVHATSDSGVMDLGVRYEALTAPASAAGDYAFKTVDDLGKTVSMPYAPPINQVQGTTAAMTATIDTSVIAAPGASIRIYLTNLTITNSHAAVGTLVNIKDGTTVIDQIYVPALKTESIRYLTPLKLTANAALQAANVTTGSNVFVTATGFKAL